MPLAVRQPSTRWLLLATLLLPGCAYTRARLADLTDVLDVEYGEAMGLGVKVEVTSFFGVGLGFGSVEHAVEKWGRLVDESAGDYGFMHLLYVGGEMRVHEMPRNGGIYIAGVGATNILTASREWPDNGWRGEAPPPLASLRCGVSVILPFVTAGLAINLGEVIDLLAGLVGADPADDDGLPLWQSMEEIVHQDYERWAREAVEESRTRDG